MDITVAHLTLFCVILPSITSLVTESAMKDYCLDEKFSASCGKDDVIIVTSAFYGRMEFGTCVQRDYGYIGCKADVTEVLANKCSGRKSCEVINLEILFIDVRNDCPGDLKSYLKAAYSCKRVTAPLDTDQCSSTGHVEPIPPLSGGSGILASSEQRWGSASCPWRIAGQPGQTINLTLHDFSDYGLSGDKNPAFCRQYMSISEGDMEKKVVACNHEIRPRSIYLSTSYEVYVAFTLDPLQDQNVNFLLEFEVVGCPIPTLPDDTYEIEHEDGSRTIQCNFTSESWNIKCQDGKWLGSLGSCSARMAAPADNLIPLGVSVIIIVGVALLVCTGVLLVGFFVIYCKRRSRHKRREAIEEERQLFASYNSSQNNASIVTPRSKHVGPEKVRTGYSPLAKSRTLRTHTAAGEYTHIWEVKHPIPVSTPEVPRLHLHIRKEAMTVSRSSPTMSRARQTTLPIRHVPDVVNTEKPKEKDPETKQEQDTEKRRPRFDIPRLPTFSTFKPDGELYESPHLRSPQSGCTGHSSQSSPLYFEINTQKRATNHYST